MFAEGKEHVSEFLQSSAREGCKNNRILHCISGIEYFRVMQISYHNEGMGRRGQFKSKACFPEENLLKL